MRTERDVVSAGGARDGWDRHGDTVIDAEPLTVLLHRLHVLLCGALRVQLGLTSGGLQENLVPLLTNVRQAIQNRRCQRWVRKL